MSDEVATKRVLHVENDRRLVTSFREVVRDELGAIDSSLTLHYGVALHMKDATDRLVDKKEKFDALIVDLMLPRNEDEFKRLEELERKRREKLHQLIEKTDHEEELNAETLGLRKDIDDMDNDIEDCLDMEGGYEVLRKWAVALDPSGDKKNPRPLEIPVIFWTARGLPEVRNRCKSIVAEKYFKWFEKPTDELEVLETVVKMIQGDA
jgi:CheY-like chemotaxis protein